MIVGLPQFCDEASLGIFQNILAGKIYFPKYFDKDAKALAKKIMMANLSKRYGNLTDGLDDILKSEWLATNDVSNFADIPESRRTLAIV